ncbi:ATP-binding protein [Ferrovibrio sp. MS7]|uniref:ATP-binding protein n=1 Tax=Ferrovibrio plantarum TaxID=3119164 RepID=UPI0031373FBB
MVPIHSDSISSFAGTLVLFLVVALLHDALSASRLARRRNLHTICLGVIFAVAALLSMQMPAAQGNGLVWDARHVAVGLGALLGGPIAGLIAATAAAAYRAWLGGVGVYGGVVSVYITALVGMLIWHMAREADGRARPSFRHLLFLSLLIGPAALTSYLVLMLLDAPLAKSLLIANGFGFAVEVAIGTLILGGGILLLAQRRDLERHLKGISDNFPGMIYRRIQRPDGSLHYPFVGSGAKALFGLEPAAIKRDPNLLSAVVEPGDRARYLAQVDAADQNLRPLAVDSRIHPADGSPMKWVRNYVRPSRGPDDSIIWDGVVVDITQQRHAEEQLRVAREQAEAANLAKSSFLASMSHELRTPLNSVLGFAQLLAMGTRDSLTEQQREFIHMIEGSGRQLLALIEQVLDLAKIEAGRVTLSMESIEANSLLTDLSRIARALAEGRGQNVEVKQLPENAHVLIDLTRFNQIITNFISNAAKYGRYGGHIEIGCRVVPDGRIEFYVADDGVGIPIEQQGKVFEAFNRLGREGSAVEGTGIGLVTAKRLAEFMQGDIGFESEAGKGSRFWVRFARTAPPPPMTALPARPLHFAQNTTGRVLYIEDNPANVLLVKRMLASVPNLLLLTADKGSDGVTMAQQERPDLILLDIHLPDMDGFEVLRQLRADTSLVDTPVIALTADADKRSLERGSSAGFNDYLTKPIQVDRFLATVWGYLGPR